MITPQFSQITLEGADAQSFLQSQLTCNVSKLGLSYQPTAIANLKGRIEFGIWIKKQGEQQFDIAISSDCMPALQAHLKKYGAFSKFTTSEPTTIYPCAIDDEPTFSHNESHHDVEAWIARSLATGNYWITAATQGLFQPQELRLHQRAGVDYDKGCYLGQETVARAKYRGANKKAMFILAGQATDVITANQDLELQLGENWRRAGTILSLYQDGEQCVLTSVLNNDLEPDAVLRIKGQDDSRLSLQALPYSLID